MMTSHLQDPLTRNRGLNYTNDRRIVLTLDAGGTNFKFSAIQGDQLVTEPISLPSNAHDLDLCLTTMIDGFTRISAGLTSPPVAISFAFPGPADYAAGIVGDLNNLPCFRGGVAIGPILREHFRIPVFMNNDGDLFAYGEAISGLLPWVNGRLAAAGSSKRYQTIFGATIGTGFGGGLVHKGQLFIGDNGAAAEIWSLRSTFTPTAVAEEDISIRAVQRLYAAKAIAHPAVELEPKDIYAIAKGESAGDREAALDAFRTLGEGVGDALAHSAALIDGLMVIGGGLSGAAEFFMPAVVTEMNRTLLVRGGPASRLESTVFNLNDPRELETFLQGRQTVIKVPGTNETIPYDAMKRIGVGVSRLGTSYAVAIGAHAFALNALDHAER